MALMTFAQAIEDAGTGKRHILLGNGFSRACRNDLFAYDALFTKAQTELTKSTKEAFRVLGTTDFESVMRALKVAAKLAEIYAPTNKKLAKKLRTDAEKLRDILAQVIANNHPERPNSIMDAEFAACRKFLRNFERVYTVNYDLLLYWALMHDRDEGAPIVCDDGFRQPEEGPQEYVEWDTSGAHSQNIFYLHGALHIFDAGAEIQKYTWCNTGIALVEQIRAALADDKYPIFVAEGESASKLERIQHSAFLSHAYRSFARIGGNLFIYGLSLAENDEHILRLIERGTMTAVYVGIYGDPASKGNRRIMARTQVMADARKESGRRNGLKVHFFEAKSASVWG